MNSPTARRYRRPISIRVIGNDLNVIEQLSHKVEEMVKAMPGTRDVKNPLNVARTNLKLRIDSRKAQQLGVQTAELDRAVRLAVSGIPVGTFKETTGEQYPIVVRTPITSRPSSRRWNRCVCRRSAARRCRCRSSPRSSSKKRRR